MKVTKGNRAINATWQQKFPLTATCICGGEARLAFAAKEELEEFYICELHENLPGEMWPHDAISVVVYLCKECLKPVAIFNQA